MENEFIDLLEYIGDHFYPEWLNVNEDSYGFIKRGDSYDDEVIFFINYNQISVDYYGMRLVRKFKKLRSQLIPYNIRNNVYSDIIAKDIGCFGTNLNDKNLNFNDFESIGIPAENYIELGVKIIETFEYNYKIISNNFTSESDIIKYLENSGNIDSGSIPFYDEILTILTTNNPDS